MVSDVWGYGTGVVAILNRNHTEREDSQFFELLQRVRRGQVTEADVSQLNESSKGRKKAPCLHTELCLYRNEAVNRNSTILNGIPSPLFSNRAEDRYVLVGKHNWVQKRLEGAAPNIVTMTVGGVIILTRRWDPSIPELAALCAR